MANFAAHQTSANRDSQQSLEKFWPFVKNMVHLVVPKVQRRVIRECFDRVVSQPASTTTRAKLEKRCVYDCLPIPVLVLEERLLSLIRFSFNNRENLPGWASTSD